MRAPMLVLLSMFLLPSAASADITTGLVGYWPFSGNADDASGYANHGTPNAAVQPTADRFGNPDSAYLFDGLSSRIDIPTSASLESPTDGITLAAWIRRDGWGMVGNFYNPILTKTISATNAFQYRLIISPSGTSTSFNNWNIGGTAPNAYTEGVWYHLASTWSEDTLRVYVNGAMIHEESVVTTIVPHSGVLSIGSDTPGYLEIFLGALDEVRIYNRALEPDDIAELVDMATAAPVVGAGSVLLGAAYPNPIQSSTMIPLRLDQGAPVTLEVVDARGRRVRSLVSQWMDAGMHGVQWNGRDDGGRQVASGVYFYRVRMPGTELSRKVVMAR
jgi:hypothetical protein